MGFYIDETTKGPLPRLGKAKALIDAGIAVRIYELPKWKDIPENKCLIAVVENGLFDAAAFCDEHQYNLVRDEMESSRPRKIVLLYMDRYLGMKLSGLNKLIE